MAYLYTRYLIPKFERYFRSGLILDVGCGKGGLEALIKTIPETNFEAEFIGIDVSLNSLSTAKTFMKNLVCAVAGRLPFRDKAFIAAFSVEVIEHLPKEQGYCHIKEMERVSKNLVVLTTPSHFFVQDPCEIAHVKHPMMHRSLWKSNEFKRLGYSVEGLHPAREYIPSLLSKWIPYLACNTLAYKVLLIDS